MGVTTIGIEDTVGGAVAKFGDALGGVLDATVFAKGIREKEYRKEPSSMQAMLPGVRAAMKAGPEALQAMADSLNVNTDFLEEINAGFRLTNEQRFDEAFGMSGGPERLAITAMIEANSAGLSAEAVLEAGLPAMLIQAQVLGTKVDIQNFKVEIEMGKIRKENGVLQVTLEAEYLDAQLGRDLAQRTLDTFEGFDQTTEQGQHDAQVFFLGLANPGALSDLQMHERMNFDTQLAMLNARQSTGDRAGLQLDMHKAWTTALKNLEEAVETDDENFLRPAIQDIRNLQRMIDQMNAEGMFLTPLETSVFSLRERAFFGPTLEVAETIFTSKATSAAAADIFAQLTIAEQSGVHRGVFDFGTIPAEDLAAIRSSNPNLATELERLWPSYIEKMRTTQFGAEGTSIFSEGTVGSKILFDLGPGQAGAVIGSGVEAIRNGYQLLSEDIKSVLDYLASPVPSGNQDPTHSSVGDRLPF